MVRGNFSKPIKRPVYWVFTQDLIYKFPWIYFFGSYNFNTKEGKHIEILQGVKCISNGNDILTCGVAASPQGIDVVRMDLSSGLLYVLKTAPGSTLKKSLGIEGNLTNIAYFYFKTPFGLKVNHYHDKGVVVEVITSKKGNYIFFFPYKVGMSMFNQMYLLRNYDKRYFKLVLDDFPVTVIYKVNQKTK